MKTRKILREMLNAGESFLTAGAHDALSARLAEQAGFKCICMGGYPTTAVLLGKPDIGLLTMTEMVANCKRICDATNLPVLADGDNGHGNALNVMRTVREFEAAGAAGIILEDQVAPKRCGHMEGKAVVSKEEHVQKLKAAVDARTDPDLVIIARTDARSVYGLDDAIDRAKAFRDAGADAVFVEAPTSKEELQKIADEIKGIPLVGNMIEGAKTPLIPLDEFAKMGYQIIFHNLGSLYTMTKAMQDYFQYVVAHGTSKGYTGPMVEFNEFNQIVGLPEIRALEKNYTVD